MAVCIISIEVIYTVPLLVLIDLNGDTEIAVNEDRPPYTNVSHVITIVSSVIIMYDVIRSVTINSSLYIMLDLSINRDIIMNRFPDFTLYCHRV